MTFQPDLMKPVGEDFRLLMTTNTLCANAATMALEALAGARSLSGLHITLSIVGTLPEAATKSLDAASARLNLQSALRLPGPLSGAALQREYQLADIYLQLDQQPGLDELLEALRFRLVPVLSQLPLALPKDCGLLVLNDQDSRQLAALLASLMERPLLRRQLIRRGEALLATLNRETTERQDAAFRIEGPFDSSYSLAMVNRFAALSLAQQGWPTVLQPTEAVGSYTPDPQFLAREPGVASLYANRQHFARATTVLRNMYPLRLTDMKGSNNGLCCYGWEESQFPEAVVADINRHLHLVCTTSRYVTRTLMDNGVSVPLFSTGDGADHILDVEPDAAGLPELGTGLRFLHISSCFPRKGVDVLLQAYGSTFSCRDDVVLIIKTFPNPHHDMTTVLTQWQETQVDPPRVILINSDLSEGAIRSLYLHCHVLVAPSRGEGFGLPMAEAMLHRMPVITTGYGGQMDFCSEDNAWLIDFRFARAETHMNLADSVWAEPDGEQLGKLMSGFAASWKDGTWQEHTADKTLRASERVRDQFSWAAVARRTAAAVASLDSFPAVEKKPRRGFVTTWNSKCGIANYSKLLLQPALGNDWILANDNAELTAQDHDQVVRCWSEGSREYPRQLFDTIRNLNLEQVHFQFNFSFFSLSGLRQLLADLHDAGIQTFITFHSTAGGWNEATRLSGLQPELSRVTRIFVHSVPDLNRLKNFGAVDNVCLFPHGVMVSHILTPSSRTVKPGNMVGKKVIASYGFLLPHKGIVELIEAFAILRQRHPDTHLLLLNAVYPNPVSQDFLITCENQIRRLELESHVTLISDYLEDSDSLAWLDHASFLVFPYQHTLESSSAAVRWGLASGKPVYCTPLDIFDDVSEAVTFLPGCAVADLCIGLETALARSGEATDAALAQQQTWLEQHDWHHLSRRLKNILLAAHHQRHYQS